MSRPTGSRLWQPTATEENWRQPGTKHIQLKFRYSQDLVSSGTARLKQVNTKDNLADLHTTSMPVDRLR